MAIWYEIEWTCPICVDSGNGLTGTLEEVDENLECKECNAPIPNKNIPHTAPYIPSTKLECTKCNTKYTVDLIYDWQTLEEVE